MSITNRALRRLASGAGALALGLAGIAALGTAASADVGPDQPDAPAEGSLTIYKYAGDTGQAVEDLDQADLLNGVQFTVTRVGRLVGEEASQTCEPIDLTEAEDWVGLSGDSGLFSTAPEEPAGDFCLTATVYTEATVGGAAIFDPLPVGIYYVEETDPGDNPIVSPVPNFYVSIPTSNEGEDAGWNYDVVVYPKNQIMEGPSKAIAEGQEDLVVGGEVTWTITVPIPSLNNEDTFTTASVSDTLDSRLTYASSTVTVGGATLVENTDYTVSTTGGVTTWTFTPVTSGDGVVNIPSLYGAQGTNITIELVTSVDSIGDGTIPNDEYSSTFNDATVPGEPTPYTYWGQLSILKTDDSEPALNLEGAEFQVFELTDASCPPEAPETGAIATGTSNASGVVEWDEVANATVLGLWVANVNNGPAAPTPTKDYCVYETVIPSGHTATAISNPVTIEPGEVKQGTFTLTVVNPRTDGPDLPLTGAGGTLAMTLGGLLLVGVGAGAIVISRRRHEA
ncbi:MAG: SpaH/EbpB family LPXTG-anchored major pilin [Ancrocorticia sp.]|jgi:fimbrial isopeptide formation D2 family protein/LPXTG-motif cell wall-anchored protein|nr:SpaH/EbpB family LPXTG-anchored major pilin [Ancrocorticia sp.]